MEMCMHVSLRGVGDTGVLSHHCSPRPLDLYTYRSQTSGYLKDPSLLCQGILSLQNNSLSNATTPAFNYTLVELVIQNWVKSI